VSPGPTVWVPPARPDWVEHLIAHGDALGGAEHLVPLDADDLLATACAATGLDDFGPGAWRDHYETFVRALVRESELHAVGRLVVRMELLRTLRNRLELTDLWRRHPERREAEVREPVFIVGAARSGTSILHELMSCDPATRAPAMWEMQHPAAAAAGEDRSETAEGTERFWPDVQPEYETMHQNSGRLPNECIFITMHEFLSDHWGGCHVVPSYDAHLAKADHRPAYRFHRDLLATLQTGGGPRRWLLKAPSHLAQLRALFDVYPDARIVRTHRDPARTLPSMIDLLGTLKWMRCARVDMGAAARILPAAFEALFARERADRASGALPDDRFVDVPFHELAADPAGTVARIHERLGWPFADETRAAVTAYARRKPRGAGGAHRYTAASTGLDPEELRERFRAYREHYGLDEEPC
jgi:hypothetical protein